MIIRLMQPKGIIAMWIPLVVFLMLYSVQLIRNGSSLENNGSLVTLIIPFLIPVLFVCLSWIFVAWRIIIRKNGLHYRNIFFQTKIIPFDDIGSVKIRENHPSKQAWNVAILYSNNEEKILTMFSEISNFDVLVDCLKKKSVKFENLGFSNQHQNK